MGKKHFYAVRRGRTTGIFADWGRCQQSVSGFSGAEFKGFATRQQAQIYLEAGGYQNGYSAPAAASSSSSASSSTLTYAPSHYPSQSTRINHQQRAHPYEQTQPRRYTHSQANGSSSSAAAAASSSSSFSPPRYGVVYIDGAARSNPVGPAGCGGLLYESDSRYESGEEPVDIFSHYLGARHSNNEAEYHAMLRGMKMAQRHGITHLVIKTDSELVAKQMTGEYSVRAPHLAVLYREALHLAATFDKCQVQHVYREENKMADKLANEAIDEHERNGS